MCALPRPLLSQWFGPTCAALRITWSSSCAPTRPLQPCPANSDRKLPASQDLSQPSLGIDSKSCRSPLLHPPFTESPDGSERFFSSGLLKRGPRRGCDDPLPPGKPHEE
ncbi:unnamed protein product [Gadus morhua 'NCC']